MYGIRANKTFKSAFKRISKSGNFKHEKFNEIIEFLRTGTELPREYYDHALTGNLMEQRECHIEGNMLLIYEVDKENKIITLANIGNHAQVFGS